MLLSRAGTIRTGRGGSLKVKQLHVDGKRLTDGTYTAPQPWLKGTGTVTVDARVDVKGRYGDCNARSARGNIANLTGDTAFSYPVSDCDIDITTNGHTMTFDSGDGNPLCYRGAISGTGNVVLLMGPSHTDYKDAPLRLAGPKPNTTTGKFLVRKGRVQLEKPDGVDAISGDVIVGGQGFNDCLFWINSNQIKDSVNITLLERGQQRRRLSAPQRLQRDGGQPDDDFRQHDQDRRRRRCSRRTDRQVVDHRRGQEARRSLYRRHREMDRGQGEGDRAAVMGD